MGYRVVTDRDGRESKAWPLFVEREDRALYAAKQAGRNCALGWTQIRWNEARDAQGFTLEPLGES